MTYRNLIALKYTFDIYLKHFLILSKTNTYIFQDNKVRWGRLSYLA